MKYVLAAFAIAAVLAAPALSLAFQYQYVDTSGRIQDISADTAGEALTRAANIAPHSGVMLVTTPSVEIPDDMVTPL